MIGLMKTIIIICTLLGFSITAFSQSATKIDEVSYLTCGDFLNRIAGYYQWELQNKPENKLYVIYYQGKENRSVRVYNKKTKKFANVLKNPIYGYALNRAKEIPIFLKDSYKVPKDRVMLVDGGYRERFGLEIWSVPDGSEPPKATPTLTRKDVKLVKGKLRAPYRLICCYGDC